MADMAGRAVPLAAALLGVPLAEAAVPAPLPRGWGSFQSPSVELLIHQTEEEYRAPHLPPFTREFVLGEESALVSSGAHARRASSASLPLSLSLPSQPFGRAARRLFFIEPNWTFINHGAFGATLRPLLRVRNEWSEAMERQPLRFLDREVLPLLVHATKKVAAFVGAPATSVTLHTNATTALNILFKSIAPTLPAGSRVLRLNLCYGAVKKMIDAMPGVQVVELTVPLPLRSRRVLLDLVSEALEANSYQLAVFDHVASNSAIKLPMEELVRLCHNKGTPVLVDGAHSLGSIPLELEKSGVDYFVSNAHKWLCNPKGAAMLYVSPAQQSLIRPLIISHGTGSGYCSDFIWTGCQDYAPLLTLISTLDLWQRIGLPRAMAYCHELVLKAGRMMAKRWGTELLVGAADAEEGDEESSALAAHMVCVRLPGALEAGDDEHNILQNRLHFEHGIEVPIKVLGSPPRLYMRISAMIYNEMADYERVAEVMWRMRAGAEHMEDDLDREGASELLGGVSSPALGPALSRMCSIDSLAATPPAKLRPHMIASASSSANSSCEKRPAINSHHARSLAIGLGSAHEHEHLLDGNDACTPMSLVCTPTNDVRSGLLLALPTPSAFLSPAPNTVLQFLSPDTSLDAGSPHQHHKTTAPCDLSFGSLHSDSPIVSAEKPKQPPSSGYPPLHHEAATAGAHLDSHGAGGPGLSPVDMNINVILCTPSTPPTSKHANAKNKRQPPAPGNRALDLPHGPPAGGIRRKNSKLAGDGSAPLLKARVAMGLSALLASPADSPPLGPCAPPNSAPFSGLDGSSGVAAAIDADALQLALDGESSLMQALNSAAKKCFGRRLDDAVLATPGNRPPPSHLHSLPVRTLSAPSPLQQLTSPMICRSGSMSYSWATRVLPRLYLGSAKNASDLAALRRHGVTHIINAADDVPNYHEGAFTYKNLHVADWGRDRGIRRVFKAVHGFVRDSGFVAPHESELDEGAASFDAAHSTSVSSCDSSASSPSSQSSSSSAASLSSSSSVVAPPVVVLLHCREGLNRSVTILLALLMLLYPQWTLEQSHAHLLSCRHPNACPFPDNRRELLEFERQRFGRNTMTDKDFLTRFGAD